MFNFKKYKNLVYDIIGSAMTVHRELNWGLLEPLYNEALYMELLEKGINCESEKLLPCYYKGHRMEKYYKILYPEYPDWKEEEYDEEEIINENS